MAWVAGLGSTMPLLSTFWITSAETSQREPNFPCFVVSVSFVCESKAGFSMRQLTKTW